MVEDTHTSRPPSPAETLRRAANVMRETHRHDVDREAETFVAVADWLDAEAEQWEANFAATQRPALRFDPPGIHHGDPAGAARNADHHARHALAVARAYLGSDA